MSQLFYGLGIMLLGIIVLTLSLLIAARRKEVESNKRMLHARARAEHRKAMLNNEPTDIENYIVEEDVSNHEFIR